MYLAQETRNILRNGKTWSLLTISQKNTGLFEGGEAGELWVRRRCSKELGIGARGSRMKDGHIWAILH